MSVCIITDEVKLGGRICQALNTAGMKCSSGQIVGLDQAEQYLKRNQPEYVIAGTGCDLQSGASRITQICEQSKGYLLAVGPVFDPKLVLGILRSGADDYLDETTIESELASALARLRSGRAGRAEPGRFLAITAPSGGSGSSLIAANLAVAFAKSNQRSLLIDLKLRTGDLAALLDLKPSHTMQDLCRVASRIDRTLFEQTLSQHSSGVSVLASPRSYDAVSSTEALSHVVELGRGLFPRLIADVDPSLPDQAIEAMCMADYVLMVMRLEFNSLRNARSLLEHTERRGVDPKKLLLIANRVGQSKEIPLAKVEEALGRKFHSSIPDDPKAALGAQNNGVPVLVEYPSSYLAKAIRVLAASINSLPAPSGGM